jgi:hypothetical protein
MMPDFSISPIGPVSRAFLERGIEGFRPAAEWVAALPYGRNADKTDPFAVFSDMRGTCSTKHALLKRLAEENGESGLHLCLGIFKMHAGNTPRIASTLARAGLPYLPEAHNYLKWRGQVLDATFGRVDTDPPFLNDLLEEIIIPVSAIGAFKVAYHRSYLTGWLEKNGIAFSLESVWEVREQCIAELGNR